MEQILNTIGTQVEIREIKIIGVRKKKDEKMVVVKIEGKERRKIIRKKTNLKGRKERILKSWTWKERKMGWKLEEITKEEKRTRNNVVLGYGRIILNGQW